MLYNVVLFVHIFGAVVMFMAIGILFTAMISMLHAKGREQIVQWSSLAVKLDGLMPLSTLLILVPAVYLVFAGWGWGIAWINVSLAILVANSIVGPIVNLRRLKVILQAANSETDSVLSTALMGKVRDRVLWSSVSIMTMLTVGILFLMAVKLPLLGSLVTMVIAAAAGLVLANVLLARTKPATSPDTAAIK
ncbi:hypothetical protein [Planococcus salinus]|uniref:DUF2269 family protein n=1 Tax=Planococcus salinus TaxID=1848460 RepID=A0A3M8P5N9_9BACL|nr:hypothetical protein [Planococcus salinus]RNF39003.1 hypothetical protein EEX84_11470 [Planococcus salinus]